MNATTGVSMNHVKRPYQRKIVGENQRSLTVLLVCMEMRPILLHLHSHDSSLLPSGPGPLHSLKLYHKDSTRTLRHYFQKPCDVVHCAQNHRCKLFPTMVQASNSSNHHMSILCLVLDADVGNQAALL